MKPGARPPSKRLPGEVGIWLLVAGDLVVFSLFFGTFLFYRGQNVVLFDRSRRLLDADLGVLNTLLLLTSSWLVAMGIHAARQGRWARTRQWLWLAILCGYGFIIIKAFEYYQKLSAGITLITNDFFMYYFMFTGIHLVHVIIGTGVLTMLAEKTRTASSADILIFENGATFWHMVDLLWIMLFPLLYLISQ